MLIVNLFGQPSCGKSTNSARLFAMLKDLNINCELVTEYAKELTLEERHRTLSDQLYVFAKQYHRLAMINDKVDVIITDSPLFLSLIYNKNRNIKEFEPLVLEVFNSFNNLNFLLKRVKSYNPIGRNQNELESDLIGIEIKNRLNEYYINYTEVEGKKESCDFILEKILEKLNK